MKVVLIGTGDVGIRFAQEFKQRGADVALVSGRSLHRSREIADSLGLRLHEDFSEAVRRAELVLSVVTGASSLSVALRVLDAIQPGAIFADLTSASPIAVQEAAAAFARSEMIYVDAAIMGAVSLLGAKTPIVASGETADRFAKIMNSWGFEVMGKASSEAGEASLLKLLRSVFAKGLETLVVETMLVARTFKMEEQLFEQLRDFDRSSIREVVEMYVNTHLVHAARRLHEMLEVESQLVASGLPAFFTRAAIQRYRHTNELLELSSSNPGVEASVSEKLDWLLDAERKWKFIKSSRHSGKPESQP